MQPVEFTLGRFFCRRTFFSLSFHLHFDLLSATIAYEKAEPMIPNISEREQEVLSRIAADPSIGVGRIAEELGVSVVTARGYLNSLSEKGYVLRVRGGAVSAVHPAIVVRQQEHQEAKRRIAEAAASMIHDGDTVMIEAGTTTALIVRFLLGRRDVSIVTNNTLALAHARGNPGLRVTVIGGDFRPSTESLVGPIAVEQLQRFHVRLAFVGTDGFSAANGLTTELVEGAEIVRCMARQAREVVAVADSGKFGRVGFVHVLPMRAVTHFVTDSDLPDDAAGELEELGTRVRRV